jgi:hypothetical protein
MELRLFVPPLIGKVCKGNQYCHGEDEHFSTVHRAIMPKGKSAAAESVAHVTARLNLFGNTVDFAVARTGTTDRSDLGFTATDSPTGSRAVSNSTRPPREEAAHRAHLPVVIVVRSSN